VQTNFINIVTLIRVVKMGNPVSLRIDHLVSQSNPTHLLQAKKIWIWSYPPRISELNRLTQGLA